MKYKIILLVIIFVLMGIGGFWYWQSSKSEVEIKTYTGQVEKITVGTLEHYSLLDLIAKEKGYFAENGLDVTFHEYTSGGPAVTDVLAGKADIVFAADFVGVINMFVKPHLRILTEVGTPTFTFELVARRDRGINAPADLRGKKIGVTRKTASEYFLTLFLSAHNLVFNDVTIIDLTPQQMVTQIVTGQIDGAVTFGTNVFSLKKEVGTNAVSWPVQGGVPFFSLMYSTDSFINKNPDVIKRYIASLVKAEQYVKENDAEARDFLIQTLPLAADYIKSDWQNFSPAIALNQALLLGLENQARLAIANKLTDKTEIPNYLDRIYFDALEAVKPEAVTIIHE